MILSIGMILLFLLLLLIVGALILGMGLRGSPVFTSPRCAKCNYDLRAMNFMTSQISTCPECGTDLSKHGAVTFGRLQSRRGLVGLGAAMIVLALFAVVLIPMLLRARSAVVAVGPAASSARSTPALLASLPTTVNQPWDWQELERRLANNTLTTAEVDGAFNVLVADLNAKRASGQYIGSLPWIDGFFTAALRSNTVSPAVLTKLVQAFYGPGPEPRMRARSRQGEPIDIDMRIIDPWNLPGMQFVSSLKEIKADDGTILKPTSRYLGNSPAATDPGQFTSTNQGNREVAARIMPNLPPGEHELSFTFDLGAVPLGTALRGIDGRPGTADKWPTPFAVWQTVVKKKVTIVSSTRPVLDTITDPQQDPLKSGQTKITVRETLARPSSRGVEIAIDLKVDGTPNPALSYRVWLLAGGQKIEFGTLMVGQTNGGSTSSISSSHVVKSLPADIRTIDIIFTPDPKVAEEHVGIERIWGGEYRIEQVPLQRFDLTAPAK